MIGSNISLSDNIGQHLLICGIHLSFRDLNWITSSESVLCFLIFVMTQPLKTRWSKAQKDQLQKISWSMQWINSILLRTRLKIFMELSVLRGESVSEQLPGKRN
jgi:hypothetical protein